MKQRSIRPLGGNHNYAGGRKPLPQNINIIRETRENTTPTKQESGDFFLNSITRKEFWEMKNMRVGTENDIESLKDTVKETSQKVEQKDQDMKLERNYTY